MSQILRRKSGRGSRPADSLKYCASQRTPPAPPARPGADKHLKIQLINIIQDKSVNAACTPRQFVAGTRRLADGERLPSQASVSLFSFGSPFQTSVKSLPPGVAITAQRPVDLRKSRRDPRPLYPIIFMSPIILYCVTTARPN
ncbi:hypothetical protein EVAR_43992_1 [Eumeta japonica]|uniref:Uncharacterized protein n=1 Tax=Eumeta variegata TaxID=151549 RepID=A0A4C1XC97_EUMVA|nr:hypothetical protein EVAR_43992_1 [Eumeta japonica]